MRLGEEMSLTIFLAICILGCDVLIYFLYEWAFGESKRIRKRHARVGFWPASSVAAEAPAGTSAITSGRIIELHRKDEKPACVSRIINPHHERLAYRRMAASFGELKRRA